jgi:hypothetical protein
MVDIVSEREFLIPAEFEKLVEMVCGRMGPVGSRF